MATNPYTSTGRRRLHLVDVVVLGHLKTGVVHQPEGLRWVVVRLVPQSVVDRLARRRRDDHLPIVDLRFRVVHPPLTAVRRLNRLRVLHDLPDRGRLDLHLPSVGQHLQVLLAVVQMIPAQSVHLKIIDINDPGIVFQENNKKNIL